eukprot:2199958-Rhodomonas_salina.1
MWSACAAQERRRGGHRIERRRGSEHGKEYLDHEHVIGDGLCEEVDPEKRLRHAQSQYPASPRTIPYRATPHA